MAQPQTSSFRILHISDLHRDPNSPFSARSLVESLLTDVSKLSNASPLVDAIVFSGDAVNRGDSVEEYGEAQKFLLDLYRTFFPELDARRDRSKLAVIPGNHDIEWEVCKKSAKFSLPPPERESEEHFWTTSKEGREFFERSTYRKKSQHFSRLLSDCTGKAWSQDFAEQFLDYVLLEPSTDSNGMGLIALGINTAYLVHHERNEAGIHRDILGHVKKLLRDNYPSSRWIRILIQHHPTRPYRSGEKDHIYYADESDLLREFSLVLHGHIHESLPQRQSQFGGGEVAIIGAGSLLAASKARPDLVGLEYNLLILDLASRHLQVFPRQRDNVNTPWRLDNRYTEEGASSYEMALPSPTAPAPSSKPANTDLYSPALNFIEVFVNREKLFEPFLTYARERDVVFALGGVGGGLDTFLEQFQRRVEKLGSRSFSSVDFHENTYLDMRNARLGWAQAFEPLGGLGRDCLDLKCLFAALAYEVCQTLHGEYPNEVGRTIGPNSLINRAHFLNYYFNGSPAMEGGEVGPILTHFFETMQHLAEATAQDGLLVLMPWSRLAACFKNGDKLWDLAFLFWEALGSVADATDKYDKVCLIVGASEVPFGHRTFKKALVAKSLWPLVPLDVEETMQLLNKVSPALSEAAIGEELMTATGGSPWFTRLVLSFLKPLVETLPAGDAQNSQGALLDQSIALSKRAIIENGKSIRGSLRAAIVRYLTLVRESLKDVDATDSGIEAAWAGTSNDRRRGYNIESPRVEAFVASGLIWLDGDPWDKTSTNYIFRDYPRLRFRPPSTLAIATYEHVTGRTLR